MTEHPEFDALLRQFDGSDEDMVRLCVLRDWCEERGEHILVAGIKLAQKRGWKPHPVGLHPLDHGGEWFNRDKPHPMKVKESELPHYLYSLMSCFHNNKRRMNSVFRVIFYSIGDAWHGYLNAYSVYRQFRVKRQ